MVEKILIPILSYTIGLVVSMSVPCVTDSDDVIGVTGVDLSLEDLTARVTHTNSEGLYAFLVDTEGRPIFQADHQNSEQLMKLTPVNL